MDITHITRNDDQLQQGEHPLLMFPLGCSLACKGAHSKSLGSGKPDEECRRVHIVCESDDVGGDIRRSK